MTASGQLDPQIEHRHWLRIVSTCGIVSPMTERETLADRIATALDDEVIGLRPGASVTIARVASRVAIENLPLVVGAMPELPTQQARANLTVVENPDAL